MMMLGNALVYNGIGAVLERHLYEGEGFFEEVGLFRWLGKEYLSYRGDDVWGSRIGMGR